MGRYYPGRWAGAHSFRETMEHQVNWPANSSYPIPLKLLPLLEPPSPHLLEYRSSYNNVVFSCTAGFRLNAVEGKRSGMPAVAAQRRNENPARPIRIKSSGPKPTSFTVGNDLRSHFAPKGFRWQFTFSPGINF